MAKLTLTDITSGYGTATALNANFALIETALENTLSRDGTSPNHMTADIDMNNYGLLNVSSLTVNGTDILSLEASAAAAAASAIAAATSATSASTSATNAATSASEAGVSAAIVADWDYLGAWVTTTSYLVNNIVYVASTGSSYICLVAHTAGTFATDLSNNYWGLLALQGAAGAGTGDMLKSENLSGLADYAIARSNLGLSIGTNVQAYDDLLLALAAQTTAANNVQAYSGADTPTLLSTGTSSGNIPLIGTSSATETLAGLVELNTTAETVTGTDTTRATHAAGVKAAIDAGLATISVTAPAWELVSTTSVTASASIDFDLQEDVYAEWKFVLNGIIPASDGALILMRPGYSSGTTFDSANGLHVADCITGTSTINVGIDFINASNVVIGSTTGAIDWGIGTAAGEQGHAVVTIGGLGATLNGAFTYESKCSFKTTDGSALCANIRGFNTSLGNARLWDAVRFLPSAGNFEAAGTIKMYGLKRTV